MRIALTLIALAVASPAAAQSATTLAYNDLEKCVQAKAADYAPLDDSLRDIATASIGACAAERDAVRDAYRKHYAALGASEAIATTQAAGMVDSLVADIARTAMATVAEARLQADRR